MTFSPSGLLVAALAAIAAIGPSALAEPVLVTTEAVAYPDRTFFSVDFTRVQFTVTRAQPAGAIATFVVQNAYPAPVALQFLRVEQEVGLVFWHIAGDMVNFQFLTNWGQGGSANDVTARDASFLSVSQESSPTPALNVGDVVLLGIGDHDNIFRTVGPAHAAVFATGSYEMFMADSQGRRASTNAIPGPASPADLDVDGDVDSDDFALFDSCKTQAKVPHTGTALCRQADFDHDNDVDGDDFGVFQRAYRPAQQPVVITPASAFASTYYRMDQVPTNLINNSGLDTTSGDVMAFTHAPHPNAIGMWHGGADQGAGGGAPVVADQYVVFDLGANHDLTRAYLWQMVQPNLLGRGIKDFRLLASPNPPTPQDAANPPASYDLTSFIVVLGPTTLTPPAGSASNPEPAVTQSFALTGAANVRQIYLDIITCHSGLTDDYVGLSEVKFEGRLTPPGP